MKISLSKWHGLGNDFVLIDAKTLGHNRKRFETHLKKIARLLADRKRGLGFDQLLYLQEKNRLLILNTDGSRAQMCGNGLRAVGLYCLLKNSRKKSIQIVTDVGPRIVFCNPRGGVKNKMRLSAEMHARFLGQIELEFAHIKKAVHLSLVDVGNPHAVCFMSSKPRSSTVVQEDFAQLGSLIENHRLFSDRTNVEFVWRKNKNTIQAYVWERGVGFTEACGSGAVAIALASWENGVIDPVHNSVFVEFPGGIAAVSREPDSEIFWLTGDVAFVFSTHFEVEF